MAAAAASSSHKFVMGYYPPDQKLEVEDDKKIINNYFLFEYPSPTFEECCKSKALETWLSEEPYNWHPYNCLPLCTKEGVIIPDQFLSANIQIVYSQEQINPRTGETSIRVNHDLIHFIHEYIANLLQVALNSLINTEDEKRRNENLYLRQFILQDSLGKVWINGQGMLTQPYLYSFYRHKIARQKPLENFKIHLCPKPEYNFWTFFKMIKLTMTMPVDDFRITDMKLCISGRLMNLRSDDELYIKLDGGSSPGIIIYIAQAKVMNNNTSKYNRACIKYLLDIAKYFNVVEDVIGNITEPVKLPFGNVCFNKLIAYASGTRAHKLDILDGIQTDPAITSRYNRSDWVQQLCDADDIASIKKYFMKNICGTPGLNVIQLRDAPLPDPRVIESMVESPASGGGSGISGRIGTANTYGGARKRKSRISKNTDRKKYKRRKTRK